MIKSSENRSVYINNDDNIIMEELAVKLTKTIILDGDEDKNVAAPTLPRIRDVKSFDEHIE
jgi:hypothetical protein